jgi:hypothetical protein
MSGKTKTPDAKSVTRPSRIEAALTLCGFAIAVTDRALKVQDVAAVVTHAFEHYDHVHPVVARQKAKRAK